MHDFRYSMSSHTSVAVGIEYETGRMLSLYWVRVIRLKRSRLDSNKCEQKKYSFTRHQQTFYYGPIKSQCSYIKTMHSKWPVNYPT